MNRSHVLDLKRCRVFAVLQKNRLLLLFGALFALGVTVGVAAYGHGKPFSGYAESVLSGYVAARNGVSFFSVAIASLSHSLVWVLAAFLCGASLLGFFLSPMLMWLCGCRYGLLSALLYSRYALKGIAFHAVLVVPPAVAFLLTLSFCLRESVGFSSLIARLTLPKTAPAVLCTDFKNYCGRYALLAVSLLISALLDAVLCCSMFHFFDFL